MYALNKLNAKIITVIASLAQLSQAAGDVAETGTNESASELADQVRTFNARSDDMLSTIAGMLRSLNGEDVEVTGDPEVGYEL